MTYKIAYPNGQDEFSDEGTYSLIALDDESPVNQHRLENRFRGQKYSPRLLKLLRKIQRRKKRQTIPESHPQWESMYGYMSPAGLYTSPLEYFSGSIVDEPGAITNNPYNNTYQTVSYDRSERIVKRAGLLIDALINSYTSEE